MSPHSENQEEDEEEELFGSDEGFDKDMEALYIQIKNNNTNKYKEYKCLYH